MKADILIVDDEADIRMQLKGILTDEGYNIYDVHHADAALAVLATKKVHLVLLDIWLEGSTMDGVELLERVHKKYPHIPVVMISGHGNIELAVSTIKMGAFDFIEKPFKTDHLLHICERAVEIAKLKAENLRLKEMNEGPLSLSGQSHAMQQLNILVDRVAPTNSRVLIQGAAGTGKGVVARMIHQKSLYADGPLEIVNCALMSPDTMEEDLFGLEDGQGRIIKKGQFERAHGGTLLLDEVSDLSLPVQGKLIRMLQNLTYCRVNGKNPITVDLRLLSSTQKDLLKETELGKFREDLYYRLNVVPLKMPLLSQRRDDIPMLVEEMIVQIAATNQKPRITLAEETMALFQAYEWPGNMRQLKNVIEWLIIMKNRKPHSEDEQSLITPDDLPPELKGLGHSDDGAQEGIISNLSELMINMMGLPLKQARELFEKDYISAQILRFGGNISKTASFIGMERSALHRKLKLLGIQHNNGHDENASDEVSNDAEVRAEEKQKIQKAL